MRPSSCTLDPTMQLPARKGCCLASARLQAIADLPCAQPAARVRRPVPGGALQGVSRAGTGASAVERTCLQDRSATSTPSRHHGLGWLDLGRHPRGPGTADEVLVRGSKRGMQVREVGSRLASAKSGQDMIDVERPLPSQLRQVTMFAPLAYTPEEPSLRSRHISTG